MKPLKPNSRRALAIAKRNLRFKALTHAEQRVAIAQDVLNRLAAKQYKPLSGMWVGTEDQETNHNDSLQLYVEAGNRCEVCALGGVISSYAFFANEIPIEKRMGLGSGVNLTAARDKLEAIFGIDAMREIEYVFERGGGELRLHSLMDTQRYDRLNAFQSRYKTDCALFKAIFTNIVKNGGTFTP